LGRIFDPRNEKELRATAKRLVPTSRPGYFNQGLMELGATICVPQNPRCTECPVALSCATRTANRPSTKSIPKQRKFKNVTWPVAIVRNNGKILLHRRAAEGILAGLWELPGGEAKRGESSRNSLRRHLRGLHGALTDEIRIGEVRHSITNRKIRAPIFLFEDAGWFRLSGVDMNELGEAFKKEWETGSFKRGGSTITMQLAKNLYLNPSQNPQRKIKEIVIAWQLEQALPKRRIFEIYL